MLWQQLDIALKGAGGSASTCQEGVGERKVCQAILQSQPLLALGPTAAAAAATWRVVGGSAAGQLLQLAPSTPRRAAVTAAAPLPAFPFSYSFLIFFFPHCLKSPWKPQKALGRKGPAHLHGMLSALDRRGAGWNTAGNEVHARHLLHLPESQGSVAASPSASCSV